jgi:hypothetical protein
MSIAVCVRESVRATAVRTRTSGGIPFLYWAASISISLPSLSLDSTAEVEKEIVGLGIGGMGVKVVLGEGGKGGEVRRGNVR